LVETVDTAIAADNDRITRDGRLVKSRIEATSSSDRMVARRHEIEVVRRKRMPKWRNGPSGG
jgi:hypothetical protein